MAELSRPDQIPALKAIWAASFPEDSHELIDRAFGRLYRPADCMVECRAGRPVSMAFLLPAVWHNGCLLYTSGHMASESYSHCLKSQK